MNKYAAGDLVKIAWTYTNPDTEGLIDPTGVFLWIKDPNNDESTLTYGVDAALVRSSTGTYYSLVDTSSKFGLWVYEAYSTGTAQAHTREQEFYTE